MAAPWRKVFPGTWAPSEAALSGRLPGLLIAEAMLGATLAVTNATGLPLGVQSGAAAGTATALGGSGAVNATITPIGLPLVVAIGSPSAYGQAVRLAIGVQSALSVGSASAIGSSAVPATANATGYQSASAIGLVSSTANSLISSNSVQSLPQLGSANPYGASNVTPLSVQSNSNAGTPIATGGASLPGNASSTGVGCAVAIGGCVASGNAISVSPGASGVASTGAIAGQGASNVLVFGLGATTGIGSPIADGGGPVSATVTPQGVQSIASVGQAETSQGIVQGYVPAYAYLKVQSATSAPLGVAAASSIGLCVAAGTVKESLTVAVPEIQFGNTPETIAPLAIPAVSHVSQINATTSAVGAGALGSAGTVITFGNASSHGACLGASSGIGQATSHGTQEYDDSEEIALLMLMMDAA